MKGGSESDMAACVGLRVTGHWSLEVSLSRPAGANVALSSKAAPGERAPAEDFPSRRDMVM